MDMVCSIFGKKIKKKDSISTRENYLSVLDRILATIRNNKDNIPM